MSDRKSDETARKRRKETQDQFLIAFEGSAGNITHACKAAGICRQTYYRWIDESDSFKKEVDDIKESTIDFAESILLGEIKNKNITATIFFLKTIGRNRGYIERQEMDIDGNMNLQVEFV